VFAIPGRVDHPMAKGCHRLLREGAALLEEPEEVLEELGIAAPGAGERRTDAPALPLDRVSKAVLEELRGETRTPDEIAELTRLPLGQVLTALVELELAGAVFRGAGTLYRRT
jgi:DNA processing protein